VSSGLWFTVPFILGWIGIFVCVSAIWGQEADGFEDWQDFDDAMGRIQDDLDERKQ